MDADNIIVIIVWGIFISIYVISSIRKNKQKDARQSAPAPAKQKTQGARANAATTRPPREKRAAAAQIQAAPAPRPGAQSVLPAEGERATVSRPMQPVARSNAEAANKAQAMLHDKDALRRTIILGQMLEPKF